MSIFKTVNSMAEQVTALDFGSKVTIDGGNVVGTVVGFAIYPYGGEARVSWWNNGTLCTEWIGLDRLKEADKC